MKNIPIQLIFVCAKVSTLYIRPGSKDDEKKRLLLYFLSVWFEPETLGSDCVCVLFLYI